MRLEVLEVESMFVLVAESMFVLDEWVELREVASMEVRQGHVCIRARARARAPAPGPGPGPFARVKAHLGPLGPGRVHLAWAHSGVQKRISSC